MIAVYQMLQEQVLLCLLTYACTSCVCLFLPRSLSPSRALSVSRSLSRSLSLGLTLSRSVMVPLYISLSSHYLSLSLSPSLSRSLPLPRTSVFLSLPFSVVPLLSLSPSLDHGSAQTMHRHTPPSNFKIHVVKRFVTCSLSRTHSLTRTQAAGSREAAAQAAHAIEALRAQRVANVELEAQLWLAQEAKASAESEIAVLLFLH